MQDKDYTYEYINNGYTFSYTCLIFDERSIQVRGWHHHDLTLDATTLQAVVFGMNSSPSFSSSIYFHHSYCSRKQQGSVWFTG